MKWWDRMSWSPFSECWALSFKGFSIHPGKRAQDYFKKRKKERKITLQGVFSSIQPLIHVQLFVIPWVAVNQSSLSITNSHEFGSKPMSIDRWYRPNTSSSDLPFSSCPQFSQYQDVFKCQLFTSGGQIIAVSASTSVFPMNTKDWFPLGWTGWIS